jgi:UDP-N-acetylmuramate--alanine ligase
MHEEKPRVHFIGIGGIGMSYLARYFKSKNWAVSGSDRAASVLTRKLQKEGVRVRIGHNENHIDPGTMLVVASQAIAAGNPELMEANRLGLQVTSFPKIVGGLTSSYETIAVAGAHGKSTTASLVALILIEAGLDPTVMVGTKLKELPQENFRAGRSSYLVLETDEYGRAFLNYSPAFAVVTNIDREHLDVYKDLSDIKKTFLKFLSRTRHGGALVLNADDKNLWSLKKRIGVVARENHYSVTWYSLKGADAKKIERTIKVPGRHNVSNALAALNVARLLGIKDPKIFSAIGKYSGSWRRMEYKGEFKIKNSELGIDAAALSPVIHNSLFSIHVFDDYAHHPAEIKATLAAFKEKYPHSPLVCIFQPHQMRRLELLFSDFIDAFKEADILILLPMYKVAGRENDKDDNANRANHPSDRVRKRMIGVRNSKALFVAIMKKYPHRAVFYLDDLKKLKKFLSGTIPRPLASRVGTSNRAPILVMMGAGDIFEYTKKLII